MYDPARDSWNEKEESGDKAPEKEVDQTETDNGINDDVEQEDSGYENITKKKKEESGAGNFQNDNSTTGHKLGQAQRNMSKQEHRQPTEADDKEAGKQKAQDMPESGGNNIEGKDARAMREEDKKTQYESDDELKRKDEQSVEADKETKKRKAEEEVARSPPRKLKKPSSRLTAAEREQKAKELREKLEREEKSKQEPSSSLDTVRSHYNERPDVGVEKRKQSPIFKLRSFNNFIKSVLIQTHGAYRAVVLDIGCGKGGDLLKWAKNMCTGWIGIDIADVSVQQAKSRYEQMNRKSFWADFCVGDAFSERVEDIVHPDAFPVDVVSIQFSLHYAFKSEETIRTLLDNVSRALKPGGSFLGTIPNADFLMEHVWSTPEGVKSWGNSLYRIQFEELPPKSLNPPFGHQYSFFLEDAVENVPEYIVPFDCLQKLCTEYGLELTYKKPFLEMFDEETSNDTRLFKLCDRMKVFKDDGSYGIDGDEREAASVYLAFCFSKFA
ncbi:hypothetical protein TRICI_001676 [Trichomonascus ciferrii]|uniref:mRNA cap guanine-N(7) methyltransferase n=1 Tax=Trichomonascus ciferrii TaxID=44093 RepID=A0A642VCA6_9ASCO|nr:hypothetical protein TRICI_001676 [Trichomonascus ciferrii]